VKIGEVAREAGVSIDTVRFYERRGVLPAAERQPSGYRAFTEAAVARIRMTRALQDIGFTLDEVIDALHAHDAGGATCDSERWRLEAVVDRIDAKIAGLQRARRNAMKALEECRADRCQLASPPVPAVRRPPRAPGRGGPAGIRTQLPDFGIASNLQIVLGWP
jgi:DNA-binding transcriptional MerR regulator